MYAQVKLIPYDKLKPKNIERALEYVKTIAMIDRSRIKFGDEKHLKGAELFCRKTRRNILTGEVPTTTTTPDFRNTYSIIGFCGIDVRTTSMRYGIMEGINDAVLLPARTPSGTLLSWCGIYWYRCSERSV